ncbi:copper resistance protein CopZ [Lysinibacillus sp. 2017]|uniref:copper chaperone CopZ n=1 Tax=unclassified Lysinibacillus TaxID=2636778 RepID=UPI000D52765B|nr:MULTISPECIES: copper chaperone CopZ [unclassified Lysinibacillus]AWE07240.1 copper resistance protein CopZ [Lysinibacillus sp. 2017]TGN34698.1 copper chaperone CopZ [Lysinibacillus sp. S2017]
MQNVTLNVQGMSCGHCVKAVESGVNELQGINEVSVNLEDAKVTVAFNEAQVSVEAIKEAIEEQGYDVK